jgi:two-component sensor histidine kinase
LTEIVTHAPVPPNISVNADGVALRIERAVPVALIASELLVNAAKHATHDDGPCLIALDLKTAADHLVLEVVDDGPGFPAGFNPAASDGLGMRLVYALAEQLAGTVKIWTDGGAHVRIEMQRFDKNGQ